ncbi:MFS transporter [Altererythrobacter salegens]|uniref:MFS transporter n=1 Tax=Croceibacterium salegens TaxID=1737568 RepID=A0A6I4SS40_9SPHN|nr:MFS transporter [Croceibacterium salegens]MXO58645.1 MFS transporter [Croceibacterium salegens]
MAADPAFETATYRKVAWKLIPLLFLGYFVAYLDRVNVGFAKLQMAGDLGFSDEVYGFGAGIFFFGYFLFEVPSNLVLQRIGARIWIARIMITWGLLSAAFIFTDSIRWGPVSAGFGLTDAEFSFYFLRFMLGVAEAGFYPGVILYLTFWFPSRRRAQVIALFMTAIPFSNVIGSPLSGAVMQFLGGTGAWSGWQWLFVVEGLPSVLVGLLVLAVLPDNPQQAKWLTEDERKLVLERLQEEEHGKAGEGHQHAVSTIFLDLRIWCFAIAFVCANAGFYALNFWMPTIIQEFGIDPEAYFTVGLIAMIPWGAAAAFMVFWSRRSDRTGERRWHATTAAAMLTTGMLLLAFLGANAVIALLGLAMVAGGGIAWLSINWSFPTSYLSGAAAAGGIAMINSIGNLGGYFGPDLIGSVREATGGDSTAAFLALAGLGAITVVLTIALPKVPPRLTRRAA